MDPEESKTPVLESVLSSFSKSSLESTINSFLSFPDSALFSNNFFFDRVLHEFLSSCDDNDYVKDQLIDRTLRRLLLLLESTKRCLRKQLTLHNSISWFLLPDLTIKVFSMLDTKSLMQVAACCTMFNKSAMEPLCYSHIDLTTAFAHADDGVVCTMKVDTKSLMQVKSLLLQRAGKELRSLTLGRPTHQNEYATILLSAYCLAPLSPDMDFTGVLFRSLHLYNIILNEMFLCTALSACSNPIDLKIVEL
uniref:F-box protein SKIP17 n=1 Tax=Noccaea caerulescens TaxID=107243 RepID=A0A1J3JA94_NOCCA